MKNISETVMKKRLFLSGLALLSMVVTACESVCPSLEPAPLRDRRVREATITRFDPTWDSVANQPSSQYSIHTFEFPLTFASSGSLPNEDKVFGGKLIEFASRSFVASTPDTTFTAHFYSRTLTNRALTGDIMVVSVDRNATPPTAVLRVSGSLARFATRLNDASATAFGEYLEDHSAEFDFVAGNATPGGRTIATPSDLIDSIRVVDPFGRDATGRISVPQVVRDEVTTTTAYDVTVTVGDVYYYRALNGIEFGVFIEDAFQAALAPNYSRVTIKFAELRTRTACEN